MHKGLSTTTSSIHLNRLRSWMSATDASGPISTNQPSTGLPFQRWFKFKEAFAPQLVLDVLRDSARWGRALP
jgi:hypothetical protein